MSATITTSSATVCGTMLEKGDGWVVLGLPGTEYRLHLLVDAGAAAKLPPPPGAGAGAGQRLTGRITARARRVDVVVTGGRYVEPLYGRPRRVQGAVATVDPQTNTITVACAPECAITCVPTSPGQKATDFAIGQLVSFDVEPGARFEPM